MQQSHRPVDVPGMGSLTSLTSPWDALPSFSILDDTLFSPTYWPDATLHSGTGLQFGLALTLDLLKGGIAFGLVQGTFGPLVRQVLPFDPDFARATQFADSFAFGGFASIAGDPFLIRVTRDVEVPAIPLPPGLMLLVSALGAFGVVRRRRAAPTCAPSAPVAPATPVTGRTR